METTSKGMMDFPPPAYAEHKMDEIPDEPPPDYETLIQLPDHSNVPPPPEYEEPVLAGVTEGISYPEFVFLTKYCKFSIT